MTAQRIARRIIIGIVVAVCVGAALVESVRAQSAAGGAAMVARIDSPIDRLAADELERWIARADARAAPLLVIELDTPGGRLDSTREMVGMIMDSPVPVAVLVTPSGARAASAGTFILAAAHIAAMSQGTTVGAAAPVDSGGNDLPETLKEKASQDVTAFLREIATERGRTTDAVKALERAVFDAAAYSATEAERRGVIDFIVADAAELLAEADGKKVDVGGSRITLATEGIALEYIPPSPVSEMMRWVSNPRVIFILLAIGAILVVIEIAAPGGWVAGFMGGALIIAALVGMSNLPVNWLALGLMVLGVGFFAAEVQAPGWGAFGATGAACFLLGGFLLFGDYATAPGISAPPVSVGYWTLGGVAAFFAVSLAGLWHFSRKARTIRMASRSSQIIGKVGVVRTALDPKGSVQVESELWSAESDSGETIASGETVVVSEMDGLTLKVFRESVIESGGGEREAP